MKQILFFLVLLVLAFFLGRNFETVREKLKAMRLIKFKTDALTIVIVAAICLGLGFLFGHGGRGGTKTSVAGAGHLWAPVPSVKPGQVLTLGDFESDNDLKRWQTRQATLTRVTDHATEGRYAAKVVFQGGVQASNLLLQDFLDSHPAYGNWSGYAYLQFDIYNASSDTQRVILKLKDADDKSWQRNLYLPSEQNTTVKVYIEDIKGRLDVARIRQLNLFRWDPKDEADFYLDNVHLVPAGGSDTAQETKAGAQDTPRRVKEVKGTTPFLFDSGSEDVGFGTETALRKVFREPSKFQGKASDTLAISMARNDYASGQLAVYAKKDFQRVDVAKSDLTALIDGKSAVISKDHVKCFVEEYVKTKKPEYSVSHVGWWPDPMEDKSPFRIAANTVEPLWVQVYAPEATPAGEYAGKITLTFDGSLTKTVPLKVKVWDFTLPKETHLKTAFDFYDGRLRRMYPAQPGENAAAYAGRIAELKKKYFLDMIQHRIMPVFNFDLGNLYTIQDIKFYVEQGLSAFAIGSHGGSFDNNWPKDPNGLNALTDGYRRYAAVLTANHWMDKAYIYTYDEPRYGDPVVAAVAKMIHQADPYLKNLICLHDLADPDQFPGWGKDIDIWCVRNVTFSKHIAQEYKDKGKEVWLYVSGPEPPYPTLVIDYPAMAYRIIPWMAWKYGITGYLYWCVNFWQDNPWQNTANTKWGQNGNGLLYYPGATGPVTSIRLEVTRDGIEDYEYLYMLAQKVQALKEKKLDADHQDVLAQAARLLNVDNSLVASMGDYTNDPEAILERRTAIAETIEKIDGILAGPKVKPADVTQMKEDFSKPVEAADGLHFGQAGQLTFDLYRGGTFIVDGQSGFAWQRSDSYRDVALIRSTDPLPKTYTLSATVGDIDYDLSGIKGLGPDPQYPEGPPNENGCYLLTIIDEPPGGHHTNDWWHHHRKVTIDIDNNVWGSGMPNPIFMIYFDKNNKMVALDGEKGQWQDKWRKALTYDDHAWYQVRIQKTESAFVLSVLDTKGNVLASHSVPLEYVWHEDGAHQDYFVIGDPHENYYQGSMKISSISMPVEVKK